MAVEKWIAGSGVGLSWTSLFTSGTTLYDLNTMPNGSSAASSTGAINNATALDLFADISVSLGSVTAAAPGILSIFLMPLNQDGTTYGDGQFNSSGAQTTKVPQATYWVGNIAFPVTGSGAVQVGTLSGIRLPPGSFQIVIQNNVGVTLASSSNVVKYWTYNLSVA